MRLLLTILMMLLLHPGVGDASAGKRRAHHRRHATKTVAHGVPHHHHHPHNRHHVLVHGVHLPLSDLDGIDISRHQKDIQWGTMLKGKYRPKFVYARCMGVDLREDARYDSYVDSATYHRIPIGTYLFYTNYNRRFLKLDHDTLHADDKHVTVRALSGSALIHFMEFQQRVDKDRQKLLPVIDVEDQSVYDFATDRERVHPYDEYLKFNVFILACLLRAEYGGRPVIYSNQDFYARFLSPEFDDFPLWLARYRTRHEPSPKTDMPFPYKVRPIMWQYSDTGVLHGIPHYVDLDHFVNGAGLEDICCKQTNKPVKAGV